jgi:hypothetical protein
MINIHHRLAELSATAGDTPDKAVEGERERPPITRTPGLYPQPQVSL